MNEVYLIDGSCFIYRAYHAIRGLSSSKGIPTNAIYGFTKILLKLIKEKAPTYMLIAFDSPTKTKRHEFYEEYKVTRPETPRDLPLQIEYIKEIVDAFGVKRAEIPGFEADDIVATLAMKVSPNPVVIVTLDKDMQQLLTDRVKIYDPFSNSVIDREQVIKKYGIEPDKLIDFMALVGDPIDNIPGVKGIGEKTASELLRRYGSLENIIENLEILKPQKVAELIRKNLDYLKLSRELVKLYLDVPIRTNLEELKVGKPDLMRLIEVFQELEFYSILRELSKKEGLFFSENSDVTKGEDKSEINLQTDEIVLFLIDSKVLINFLGSLNRLSLDDQRVKELLSSNSVKILYNGKEFFKRGLRLLPPFFDLMIAAYLINPNRGKYELKDLVFEKLGESFDQFSDEKIAEQIRKLYNKLSKELEDKELLELYSKVEAPLIEVLAHMERSGIKISLSKLNELKKAIARELELTKDRIYALAGVQFNINSPRQLAEILYDKLGLKSRKRGKKARSTEMEILEELALQHELPREIMNYRVLNKLLAGYLEPLKDYINPQTQRVHARWSQTIAGTGRIVSSEPNLQNIPVKGQWAELLREIFVPEEGYLFISADYSQIELRILAHLSEDPSLINAFKEGKDIHRKTASEIFSIKEEDVTDEQRRIAKTVNFGISYGISAFGLSESIKIPYERAQELIDLYFLKYPKVKSFIERTIDYARKNLYVRTLFGRIRPLPDINSPNQFLRQQAERVAVNTVVQGTAADLIKIAMVRIYERICKENLDAKIILQIHDEIVIEVLEKEINRVSDILKEEMVDFSFSVPLEINLYVGKNLNL